MGTNSPIDFLSDEILVEILQQIQNRSTAGALFPSLLTCRRWNRIGTPISHRDILIRNQDLTTSIAPLSAHSDEVYSLTVRLQPYQVEMYTPEGQPDFVKVPVQDPYQLRTQGSRATQALWKDMESFATLISKMSKLATFSLILEPGESPKLGFWIHLRCLLTILEALPKSVSSLELDLGLLDAARDGGPTHLCHALSRLLPQLRHLRLRLGTLCAVLFDLGEGASTAQHLETLVINTSVGAWQKTCDCVVLGDYTPNAHPVHIMDNSGQADYWPSVCLSALQSGIFPNIKRFDVFAFEHNDSWPSMESDGGEDEGDEDDEDDSQDDSLDSDVLRADRWKQHDILTQKTYHLPLQRVAQDRRSLMLRTRLHEEVYGDMYATEQKAEGPAWLGTVGGLRFPASFAASKEAVDRGYVWGDSGLEDREGFRKRSRFVLGIWAKEKRDDRWILPVGEVDHL